MKTQIFKHNKYINLYTKNNKIFADYIDSKLKAKFSEERVANAAVRAKTTKKFTKKSIGSNSTPKRR